MRIVLFALIFSFITVASASDRFEDDAFETFAAKHETPADPNLPDPSWKQKVYEHCWRTFPPYHCNLFMQGAIYGHDVFASFLACSKGDKALACQEHRNHLGALKKLLGNHQAIVGYKYYSRAVANCTK